MIEDKGKSFEDIFNEWYKKFLEQEKEVNEEIARAKGQKEEILEKSRKEIDTTIKNYQIEQNYKLESEKNVFFVIKIAK
jgi:hypothetical protein